MLYENPELQQKARSHIPHQQLSSTAQQNLKVAKDADPGKITLYNIVYTQTWLLHTPFSTCLVVPFVECKLGIEDFLVLELLRWFKQDFFTWVDSLPCSRCGGVTQNSSSLSPSTDDLRWGAQRVENHYCNQCNLSTRFPRFVCVCVCIYQPFTDFCSVQILPFKMVTIWIFSLLMQNSQKIMNRYSYVHFLW